MNTLMKYRFNLYLAVTMLASSICFSANLQAAASSAPSSRYMGGPAELVTAPNGAIVNKEVLEQLPKVAWTNGPEIENPAKGVYVLGGYLISACIVVEADEGLIVFDTGDTRHDGEKLLKAIRTFSKKPIKAIVYGHTHYPFGAGVMAEGNKDVMVIGHPDLNDIVQRNLSSGGAPAYFPEVSPYLTARALQQFNAFLPDKGPDAWYSPTNLNIGEVAFLPVDRAPEEGEEFEVLGIKTQFFTRYGTDDKGHTTVWLPEQKIVLENALWGTPPNMYSIRGDLFRDARFSPLDVGSHQDRLTVILRQNDPGSKRHEEIEYEPTEETERMSIMLAKYNELLASAFIDIPTLHEPGIEADENGKPTKLVISQRDKFVRRIFNRGSFDCGGRFYGGWWQRCQKERRAEIFINDQPTNEIDFSAWGLCRR